MSDRKATFAKRQREMDQKDRARQRLARRAERKEQKASGPSGPLDPDVDPDLAGIVPGPQPLPYDVNGLTGASSPANDDDDDAGSGTP